MEKIEDKLTIDRTVDKILGIIRQRRQDDNNMIVSVYLPIGSGMSYCALFFGEVIEKSLKNLS